MSKDTELKETVRKAYREIALREMDCCGPTFWGSLSLEGVSKAIGYSSDELSEVPDGANLGLGCGNPVALASISEGETVLDLGSGAGFDCFLAANNVGLSGHVIGVDMTHEMLAKARANAEAGGYTNVEFRLGELEALPVADNSVDLIISNCVINLVPDQNLVFREAFRVLKPGGRLMVSDTIQTHELPPEVLDSPAAKAACLSAAITKEAYLANIEQAGFQDMAIQKEGAYPSELSFEGPLAEKLTQELGIPEQVIRDAAQSMVSISVVAYKL